MHRVNFEIINKAYERIGKQIVKTPLITNENINKITKANVFFKLENLQSTGSFKIRGATNKIDNLNLSQKQKGVVAFSSGNHAQAVAYVSMINKINAKIVMPKSAPQIKINNTIKYGAEVILYDDFFESREEIGNKIAKDENRVLIKPFDDEDVISGQGTSGLEISRDLNSLKIIPDIYLCCCGGGGLIAGTSTYLKHSFPKIICYSVEPEEFNDTQISLKQNKIVSVKKGSRSICDALLAPQPGNITFDINKKILSGGLSVSDYEVKNTIIKLAEELKIIVEPGGAVATAALLNNKLDVTNKTVVVMVSGGNIDNNFFSKIVNKI